MCEISLGPAEIVRRRRAVQDDGGAGGDRVSIVTGRHRCIYSVVGGGGIYTPRSIFRPPFFLFFFFFFPYLTTTTVCGTRAPRLMREGIRKLLHASHFGGRRRRWRRPGTHTTPRLVFQQTHHTSKRVMDGQERERKKLFPSSCLVEREADGRDTTLLGAGWPGTKLARRLA